ncbi:MAG TPA: DMT family transporter [Bacteroidota bacterium]|nr:DMT family transporter [Bacteroidota bacterium]
MNRIKISASLSKYAGTFYILSAVLFWGSSAPIAKHLITHKYSTLTIVQTRALLSFCFLSVWFLLFQRRSFRIDIKDIFPFSLLGCVGLALTNYTYYFTVVNLSVAVAILIQYTAPILVVVYSGVLKKEEPLLPSTLISLVLACVGCALAVTNASFKSIQLHGLTWITGPLSAFAYAFQIIATKRLLKKYSLNTVLIYMLGFASVFWFCVNPPWDFFNSGYSGNDWIILALFACVSVLIPQALFAKGLSSMSASNAGILTTFEPVVAIGIAFLILGETIGIPQVFGGILVIGAIVLINLPQLEKK